jgi:hypothetical protein
MSTRGVVYIVDAVFHELLKFSLRTLRRLPEHASMPVTIYAFQDPHIGSLVGPTQVCQVGETFNGTPLGSEPNRRHRVLQAVLYAGASPYDITLYIDADTFVCQDVSPLFDMLEQSGADLAAASEPYSPGIEPLRFFLGWPDSIDEASACRLVSDLLEVEYPGAIDVPYFNAGVLCARRGVWAVEWLRLIRKLERIPGINPCDSQLALQAAVTRTRAKHLLLSPAWNHSFRTQQDAAGNRWDLLERNERVMLHSLIDGTSEPLRIHHAIGAIHWMPSVLSFPPNLLYIDGIRKLLANW